ncbi:MAG: tryptophan synthase subunit beta, partial [Myxococcales bacterium]|nr:tryptophan synthase subunit beta [Myxococcales bacterium]
EHSHLKDTGRAKYIAVTDDEALAGFQQLTRLEGILPALESSHAIGALPKIVAKEGEGVSIVVCLSGRGDKDLETVQSVLAERAAKTH